VVFPLPQKLVPNSIVALFLLCLFSIRAWDWVGSTGHVVCSDGDLVLFKGGERLERGEERDLGVF
jgi:hypothetical protein